LIGKDHIIELYKRSGMVNTKVQKVDHLQSIKSDFSHLLSPKKTPLFHCQLSHKTFFY